MRLVVIAPGIEHQLKEINETLQKIHSVMADDFSVEDASVKETTEAVSEALSRIPNPESEQSTT